MENASKALIIAGAILISILIIGLGVFIYNQAANTVGKANLGSQEAQAQNQQFEAYFGEKKSAADVKALMSLIRSNNLTDDTDGEKYIYVYGIGKTPSEIAKAVKAGKTYNVKVDNDDASDDNLKAAAGSSTGGQNAPSIGASTPAYYKSGYIKVIHVTLSSGTTGSTGTQN